ncbi:hypothetical protein JI666_04350 [Bacillus sp. NTK071]|uniref:sporulation protein YpjB n=1 Tax=Bacillus sp. NTK071 TaxID=2802175 RepID=UPI001A8C5263|nr:sporulation protein YpjB [Bacillus sp. NTK071]MBN8207967.1 hypothetical protein [Bacillus sp. NTK071]
MGRRWLLLVIILMMFPVNVHASDTDTKQVWNDIAANVLEFGKQEKFDRAKIMLEEFAQAFPGEAGDELTTTELRVVLNAHDRAMQSITAVDKANEQRIQALTEFRLAVDALVSTDQPMWRQMDDKLLQLIDEMSIAIEHGDVDVYEASKKRFLGTYSIIKPATAIDLSVETQQRLDSHIAFIERYASGKDKNLVGQLQTMHDDFEKAFDKSKEEDEASILWMIVSIGGIITLTLAYVVFLKYRGEKEMKKSKQVDKI